MTCFINEARRQDGKPYPPNMLYFLVCALQHHMREVPSDSTINLVDVKEAPDFCAEHLFMI